MGTGYHGGFGNTFGEREQVAHVPTNNQAKTKAPIFDDKGHITLESISARAEFFLVKSTPQYLMMIRRKSILQSRAIGFKMVLKAQR